MKFRKLQPTIFCADFETTVDDDTQAQNSTEVWSAAIVKLHDENVHVFSSITAFFEWVFKHTCEYKVIYFHNIKFDGAFILDWVLKNGFKNGFEEDSNHFKSKFELKNNEISYVISSRGQWYEICMKYNGVLVEMRDSLKLLPLSLKAIGSGFGTKHQKLEMDYKGNHYAGCEITKEEMSYIKNDVLVLKEALELMFSEGHTSLTIGSCCLKEYEALQKSSWERLFPNLELIKLDEDLYGASNVDRYLRRSYRGGWCYLAKGKEGTHYNGVTCDVNSLYPSMMHSSSGNRFPVGEPHFWRGSIPAEAINDEKYYFVRIRCRFKIKDGYLPWLQIKGSAFYCPTECLEDSDFTYYDKESKSWKKTRYMMRDGEKIEAKVTLTFTQTDYKLFKDHYEVYDEEVLDGCWFYSEIGIFDCYIDKYAEIKMTSEGARRLIAKLFLNNLYGKLSSSPESSYKIARVREDGVLTFETVIAYEKDTVYIAAGSAITSYAKNFTIRAAQENYHGPNNPGFCYADTDSIHCDFSADNLRGVKIHPTEFNSWKVEASWDVAEFVRQKTYIEHVTHEDLVPLEKIKGKDGKPKKPYFNVKCAGLPENCKKEFIKGLEDGSKTLKDFNVGLELDGKLLPRRVQGGIVLTETKFTMH